MPSEMRCKIEEDGTITVETDQIAGQHHISADELLRFVREKMGGEHKVEKRRQGVTHHHEHEHAGHGHGHHHH